ncbi:PilN domain-containing protein [Thermogutta sp.]|uniref:PilN domain-containing protein n=1 Tax=Thermogutta sp. TaxID=1962930 RepID=UPI003C7C5934
MSIASRIELDFLPVAYRASLEKRRRAIICLCGIGVILLAGTVGVVRQAWQLAELLRLRDSLRIGLPVLEKARQEEQEITDRLAKGLAKAQDVSVISGGVPVGWLMYRIFLAVPHDNRLEAIRLQLERPQRENASVNMASAGESAQTPDQLQRQLRESLDSLENSVYRVAITGQAALVQDVQRFMENLRSLGIFNEIDLQTIDEVNGQDGKSIIQFSCECRLPYAVYRLPRHQEVKEVEMDRR